MKRNVIRFFTLAAALLLSFSLLGTADAAAQAQIKTRKARISDFTTKTTRVVLRGEDPLSSAIVSEITSRWRISPYEFCSIEEFEKQKTSSDYYFLVLTGGRSPKEGDSGILALSLVKGGSEQDPDPSKVSMTLVSFPLSSAENPSGRELVLLPAAIDIIQEFTSRAMLSDKDAYSNLTAYSSNFSKNPVSRIVLASEDVSGVSEGSGDSGVCISEEADEIFERHEEGTQVGFIVAPSSPVSGQYCYKMLIDAATHELCWFKRERIKEDGAPAFTGSELKSFSKRIK